VGHQHRAQALNLPVLTILWQYSFVGLCARYAPVQYLHCFWKNTSIV
jgi:hypothetical protein